MSRNHITLSFILLFILIFFTYPAKAAHEYTIDINKTYQEIEGFGASVAWYENYVTAHPNKAELYDVMFKELDLDFLRLQNWYGKRERVGQYEAEIIREAEKSLGRPIKVLISSWTPPEDLKSNAHLHGGTLIKENGEYAYDKFADYWYQSLLAYAEAGIVPDYISIQNEPDYEATWNSCVFAPTETEELAGYDKALAAVYEKLHQEMENPPLLLGPETIGLGYSEFYKYLEYMNLDYVYAIAHHLYSGGDYANPATFTYGMNKLAEDYKDKPKFQTEFERGKDGLKTAWLIHTSLVEENVNAYFYWDLIWDNGGLVFLESPYYKYQWRSEKGFYRTDEYYAFKHFSGFIKSGFYRIEVEEGHNRIKVSAYISPDNKELIIVGINTLVIEQKIKLNIHDFNFSESEIYTSVFVKDGEKMAYEGLLDEEGFLLLPQHSIVTIRLLADSI